VVQALLTGALVLVGSNHTSIALVLAATFVGALGHVTAIASFMVSERDLRAPGSRTGPRHGPGHNDTTGRDRAGRARS
jgi:hypothetical protein